MFGRSGQMFPRRTFHDAIYEEEYGSDNEDECCRCRGLSAILCWFLSVIILVGLAATVVLTVFFILRSRTMMVKPTTDVDVEMYGKDQNLFEANAAAGSSKELLGSNESSIANAENGGVGVAGGSLDKRKKILTKLNGRGPPDATKNDVDADVNEDQNTIAGSSDEDQAEDASVSHPRNQHPNHHTHLNNGRHNRLQPYSPVKTTTTTSTTTTEAPADASDEENAENESSSEEEIETHPSNGEGSSLFNLFSGPRNPSYSTPSQQDEEEETEDDDANNNEQGVISAEASAEFKSTRYHDGSPVQQVLFTESPKVTLTTPSPYNNRRNLQTTRFPMGRTSFSTTSTTELPAPQEESEEEEGDDDTENQNDDEADEHNEEHNNEEDEAHVTNHEHDEEGSREEDNEDEHHEESHDDNGHDDKSSEEATTSAAPTTTSMYDHQSSEKDMGEMGSESGESQLKQMLLDSIPPHGENKDDEEGHEDSGSNSNEPEGGISGSSEFNLSQSIHTTSTSSTTTTTKPSTTGKTLKPKSRQDTLSRLISRNFTRKGTSSTTETAGSERETATGSPSSSGTTIGPAGHKYDYTLTPVERTKMKTKSGESVEQENTITRAPPKSRYRSTTAKPNVPSATPSVSPVRTRGTTTTASAEYSIKMGSKRGSVESPIDIVPSPDLSKGIEQIKHQPNSLEGVDLNSASSEDLSKTSSEQQFLDVLVGSEDHKSLVTKKTDDGVVTSAILPPWYDSKGANSSISDVLATNGTLLSNTVAKVEDSSSGEHPFSFGKKKVSAEDKNNSKGTSSENGGSEFDRLVSMFSKQEASSEEQAPPPSKFAVRRVSKPVTFKKPTGPLNSKYIPQVPGRASLFPSPSSIESSKAAQSTEDKSAPSPASPEAEAGSSPAQAGDVGRTGALPTAADVEAAVAASGYYPEHEEENSEKTEEQEQQQHAGNERLDSEETEDSNEQEEDPSHVIDVNFDDVQDSPAEIVIEQDSSAPTEDEEGDFVEDDYNAYGENPPTLSMSGSEPKQNVVPPPEEFVRGSGIRKPMSSEEVEDDLEESASERVNITSSTTTTTTTTTTPAPRPPPSSAPVAVIRRPAYTREEILKSSVRPSLQSKQPLDNTLNKNQHEEPQGGSMEAAGSGEYEEYEDDNYEGGSVEQDGEPSSLERWSSEKSGQRWSAPDQIRNSDVNRQKFHSDDEIMEPTGSTEITAHPSITPRPNSLDEVEPDHGSATNSTGGAFKPPPMVSFHENKLNFVPPAAHNQEYHSKDGWRPVISGSKNEPENAPEEESPPADEFFSAGSGSLEPDSTQAGSYEPEQDEPEPHPQIHLKQQQQQLFQEQLPPHSPSQQVYKEPISPPPIQLYKEPITLAPSQQPMVPMPSQQSHQWAQPDALPSPPNQVHQSPHDNKMKPMIPPPPPVPAIVKFPDSEEDHEDRHHHGRNRLRRPMPFDRQKFLNRPVPPPIVMRRHPPNNGPYPPNRQGPPPNNQQQRPPPMVAQASQSNPQYELSPQNQGRPHGPITRNFHMRPNNPLRRFNYGPPQAQPRSGGNIKWPTDDEGSNKNRENSRSEVSNNNKRRRRRRRTLGA